MFRRAGGLLFLAGLSFKSLFGELLYVANIGDNTVSVIDASTSTGETIAVINVGTNPIDVAITPNGSFVYVTNQGSANVSVINTTTKMVIATVPVGSNPAGVAVSPDGTQVYVANRIGNSVSFIDTDVNTTVATITVGGLPKGIVSTGNFVYVSQSSNSTVAVINPTTHAIIATISVVGDPQFLAVSPDEMSVYAPAPSGLGMFNGTLDFINANTNMQVSFPMVGMGPNAAAVTRDNLSVYVADPISDRVDVVDVISHSLIDSIDMPDPMFVAMSYDGNFAYVSLDFGFINVIDLATNTVVRAFVSANGPRGIAVQQVPLTGPQGRQINNRFLTQSDLVNIITWDFPSFFNPISYQIFRDASFTDLAAEVPAATLEFEDHNRKKKQFYTYYILGIDESGGTLNIGNVTVVPIL